MRRSTGFLPRSGRSQGPGHGERAGVHRVSSHDRLSLHFRPSSGESRHSARGPRRLVAREVTSQKLKMQERWSELWLKLTR